ncbi:hypothetical protein Hypma_003910 [Hypsizygus marmoreus]|uniref:Uncharacterized protein n=1 Tax=Hypsizygus marmoreus TaxID=39966 RepID=A0A369K404_HYPMA|nr:hypothetical protein Hypma_003910 [Hypsizygus marmoreus]
MAAKKRIDTIEAGNDKTLIDDQTVYRVGALLLYAVDPHAERECNDTRGFDDNRCVSSTKGLALLERDRVEVVPCAWTTAASQGT